MAVDKAASRTNYYRLVNEDGTTHKRVEAHLAQVECHTAPIIEKLLSSMVSLSDGEEATLAHFLALLNGRTPAGRQRAASSADVVMRMLLTNAVADTDTSTRRSKGRVGRDTPEEREGFRERTLQCLRNGGVAFRDQSAVGLQTTFKSAGAIASLIFQLHWTALIAREGEFITSDTGLAVVDPTLRYPWSGNALNSSPGAQTTVPLSRHFCLLLTPTDPVAGRRLVHVGQSRVDEINLRTYGCAERFVFGLDEKALTRVHEQAEAQPQRVPQPRPPHHVLLFEADSNDDGFARENERRGWPPRLPSDGEMCDYVVFGLDDNPAELTMAVNELGRKRAAKRLGTDDFTGSTIAPHPRPALG